MRINGTLQTLEARKDMLACLFYFKGAAIPGGRPSEARVLYREVKKRLLACLFYLKRSEFQRAAVM